MNARQVQAYVCVNAYPFTDRRMFKNEICVESTVYAWCDRSLTLFPTV